MTDDGAHVPWGAIAGLIVGITLTSVGAKVPAELAIGNNG
jgi:hypothetical protein